MTGVHFPLERIPRDLSRPARTALFAICLNCNEETGEVEATDEFTPQQLIALWCGWEKRDSTIAAITELEAHRLVCRVGRTRGQALFLLVLAQKGRTVCEVCGGKAFGLRGARYCATCTQGRRREWKGEVLEVWRRGKIAGLHDSAIIQRAYNKVRRIDADGVEHVIPRWGRTSDEGGGGGRTGGDGASSEGLIPAMVEMGLIGDEWLDLAKKARRDSVDGGET